jgi:hypothetical protein
MAVLTPAQIAERIALYERYAAAQAKLADIDANLPTEAPPSLAVTWTRGSLTEEEARATFVVLRAWTPLRKAMLADAEKELADAEAAVLKFERGEEVEVAGTEVSG